MIRALLVEDEKGGRNVLMALLKEYHQEITIVGIAENFREIREKIDELQPNLLFLDIKLENHGETQYSIDLITSHSFKYNYPIIITTAESGNIDYYKRAFNSHNYVIDYLIKVITQKALTAAIEKAKHFLDLMPMQLIIEAGKNKISMALDDILYCEVEKTETTDGIKKATGRTIFVCKNNPRITSEKPMAFYQKKIEESNQKDNFFCTHDCLHHRKHIKQITQTSNNGGIAIMSNNDQLPIAINQFPKYKKWLNQSLIND